MAYDPLGIVSDGFINSGGAYNSVSILTWGLLTTTEEYKAGGLLKKIILFFRRRR